jgi:superfamily I DNA and/or RNA helicase/very-short-patch-repair endonuclease
VPWTASVNKFINKFDFEMFKSVKIWLLTPEVVSEIIPLQKGVFDLVVFDEASQMYVERGVPSVFRAKKVVIAGDHKQLRPSSLGAGRTEMDLDDLGEDEEVNSALEEESLLDLARFKYRDIMLNFHYRSQYEELIAFSNYAFYKGNLRVSPNAVDPELPPIEVHQMEDARWEKRANRSEAVYIVELLRKFFKERKHQETVGIITFNSSQRDLIDDLIDEACVQDVEFADLIRTETGRRKDGEDIGLFVKNIESVQGDERDVIIFSIGYAKNEAGKLVRNFGWLNQRGGENRLNVAISRAKKKIHVVTSFHPSELQVDDMKNDGPRILKKYLEYSFAVSERNSHAARQILLSFGNQNGSEFSVSDEYTLSQQVRSALEELGYQVESNVGIGGYSIDLAVRKNGKYLLGIECDGRLYERSKSARDRDYHRQKYLEARGWKIYRLWSSRWWKNAPRELQKIQELIG